MKKKIVGAFILAIACMGIVWGQFFYEKNSVENNLMLANVEALASGDVDSDNYIICYSESKVVTGYTYYDCNSCKKVYDEKGKGGKSKCFKK